LFQFAWIISFPGIPGKFYLIKPGRYILEAQKPGEPYSATSLENVLKNGLKKAWIGKPFTLNWLSHSYATHLLE